MKKLIVSFFLLLIAPDIFLAQYTLYQAKHIGFFFGANIAFGTHFQRLGLNCNLLYVNSHFQANSEVRLYYSFKNLGPKFIYPEVVLAQGLLYSFGGQSKYLNLSYTTVSNQTGYKYAVAYSYNAYFNKKKTTQQTGLFALHFNEVAFITENDIFARPTLDRFRTGAFLLQYQFENQFQLGLNCSMWTGKMGHRKEIANDKVYSHCYMDTSGNVYANLSHGLLSLQFKYKPFYFQSPQANLGIDAEQIRNIVQNRIIHDARFIPKALKRRRVCHIPMLDENGNQYLYREDQKIRKPKVYINLFSNASVFY